MTGNHQMQLGKILWDIAGQAQRLDILQTRKKGLMQQLFPSPEEMQK